MRSHTQGVDLTRIINDVQQRRELVRLVYPSHERWPLSYSTGHQSSMHISQRRELRISVLDSSFNPPTLAHLALARSLPPKLSTNAAADSDIDYGRDYDARLLLLSVRNADKAAPKAGEATYEQRLQMMILLAQQIEDDAPSSDTPSSNNQSRNIAVAIIDEPTFIRKSTVLRQYLQDHIAKIDTAGFSMIEESVEGQPRIRNNVINLSFLMGFDTLERFLAPRYYNNSRSEMHDALRGFFAPPPEGDGSRVLCAWRGEDKPDKSDSLDNSAHFESTMNESRRKVQETLSIAQPFITSGCLSFTLLTNYEMTLSSTEVRKRRAQNSPDWTAMVPSLVANYITEKLYVAQLNFTTRPDFVNEMEQF